MGAEVADRRQKLAERGLHDVIQKRKHPRANRVLMTTALWESGIGVGRSGGERVGRGG